MNKLNKCITEYKSLLVSLCLVLCYGTGLLWIAQTPAELMKICSPFRYVSYLLFLILACHTIINALVKQREEYSETLAMSVLRFLKEHIYLSVFTAVSCVVLLVTRHTQPLIFLFMILAMADTGFDRQVKVLLYVHIGFMLAVLILYQKGVFENVLVIREDGTVRYSLGYLYPLELQGHFLVIALMLIYYRGKKFRFPDFAMVNIINLLLFLSTDARMGYYVVILVTLSALIVNLIGADRVMRYLHLWFWEGCALLSVILPCVLVYLYKPGDPFWTNLDRKSVYRISYTSETLDITGHPIFGEIFEWVGNGGTGAAGNGDKAYNWIDFSFIKDSVDYGWIFVVLLVLGYLFMVAWFFKKKNVFGVIMIEGLMLSAMMEYCSFLPSVYPLILVMCEGIILTNGKQLDLFHKTKGKQ